MNLNDLIDFCRAEALSGKLFPDEESDWRWFCREYSRTFHTSLHLVFDLDPEAVILAVLEDGYDKRFLNKREDAEKVIEDLRRLEDPNYDATQEKEFSDFATGIEEWENQRLKDNKPLPTKFSQRMEEETDKNPPKTGGFIDLSYLENSEDER